MGTSAVSATQLIRWNNHSIEYTEDLLAAEEPLEIRLGFGSAQNRMQQRISVTMRTPGNDFELAIGFLFTEGIIQEINQVSSVQYCTELNTKQQENNVVRVELADGFEINLQSLQRNFYTTSSCGVCGKSSIDAVFQHCDSIASDQISIVPESLLGLNQTLRNSQTVFTYTGGIHASAFFDIQGNLKIIREDVGRHNALDKLIGASLSQKEYSLKQGILFLSGRASFELIQKAVMAQIPVVVAVGAPSSLAVDFAKASGITLVGFLKENKFNIYCGEQRIAMR
jgi:FdhD protein